MASFAFPAARGGRPARPFLGPVAVLLHYNMTLFNNAHNKNAGARALGLGGLDLAFLEAGTQAPFAATPSAT